MRQRLVLLCGLIAGGLLLGATARPSVRELLILNRGDEAIFWVSVGHADSQIWSADMLAFNDVVDVGEAKLVSVPPGSGCIYDLRAKYRDGDLADVRNINLCTNSSVSFNH